MIQLLVARPDRVFKLNTSLTSSKPVLFSFSFIPLFCFDGRLNILFAVSLFAVNN